MRILMCSLVSGCVLVLCAYGCGGKNDSSPIGNGGRGAAGGAPGGAPSPGGGNNAGAADGGSDNGGADMAEGGFAGDTPTAGTSAAGAGGYEEAAGAAGANIDTVGAAGANTGRLNDALVAHYLFNGDATDAGPNHLDGTLNGTATFANDRCGRANAAYVLNGTDSYADLSASALLKPPDVMSVSVWIRTATVAPAYQNILSDHSTNESSVGSAYILRFAAAQLQFIVGGVYGLGTSTYAKVDMSSTDLDVWRHIVSVYDRNTIRLYVDGSLRNAIPFTDPIRRNSNPVLVGKSGYGEFFHGSIDDLRIYERSLDDQAVAALHSLDACP